MKVNKFNIYWQIVRVKARDIKDVDEKINFVVEFLEQKPNTHNLERVRNWLKMTSLGYTGANRKKFEKVLEALDGESYSSKDLPNDLTKIRTADLQLVHKDLSKRKYGFQFNKTPQAHIDFMEALEKELKKR